MKQAKMMIDYWCRERTEPDLTGQGVTVAILDTGAAAHPDLTGRIIGWKDCVNHRESPYDDNGHGTHVAGILAGDGRCMNGIYAGIAPKARLVAIKVLDREGKGEIGKVIQGIRYILERKKELGIRIVNISIGTLPHPDDRQEKTLLMWVERLWDEGMIVFAAAGNLGPEAESITIPGSSRKIITVGTSTPFPTQKKKNVRIYSGCGPTSECIVKPDLVAPGNQIYSCNYKYPSGSRTPYVRKNGTSMSTPIVSGCGALLLEKYPGMKNIEVKMRMWNSCRPTGAPKALEGHGLLSLELLLK